MSQSKNKINVTTIALLASSLFVSASTLAAVPKPNDTVAQHVYPEDETYSEQVVLDELLIENGDRRWNYKSPLGTPVTVKYIFRNDDTGYVTGYVEREYADFEKKAVKEVMTSISKSVGVNFVETFVLSDADFAIGISPTSGSGAEQPPRNDLDASFLVNVEFSESSVLKLLDPQRGQFFTDLKHDRSNAIVVIFHELGHILGLDHPFDSQNDERKLGVYSNYYYTTLEYLNGRKSKPNAFSPTSLRKMDILALQHLYGKSQQEVNSGNTIHAFDNNYDYHQLIVDSNGDDTISLENVTRTNIVDLRPNAFSSIATNHNPSPAFDENTNYLGVHFNNLTMHPDAQIENVIGGSNSDELIGNKLDNEISGVKGDDKLRGLGGDDTLDGGEGIDTAVYDGELANYTIVSDGETTFEVSAKTGSEGLDTLHNIEKLQFSDKTVHNPVIGAENQVVNSGDTVTLDSKGTDADNDNLVVVWLQIGGLEVDMQDGNKAKATFVAPNVKKEEVLTFRVGVSDGVFSPAKTVTVTIQPKTNAKPVLDNIANVSVNEKTSVSLTANATDADGDAITYQWTQTSGSTVTLTGADTKTVKFTAPDVTADTTLTFKVTASDGKDSVETTVSVTVKNVAPTTGNDGGNNDSGKSSGGGSMGWIFTLPLLALALVRRKRLH
ncbi:PKD domain-containing protein [Parashewanella tropica]|uniref:PKD domain-containing protein n=1 Tax=Parashewanella tropica TaxID=2547970 RepID=UPI00105A5C2F|nr:GlyGly-CTERM sorting domain-containing protein [Parashewanella tropica]